MLIDQYKAHGNITNAMCRIVNEAEFLSLNTPKVVFNKNLLYMSRAPIPTDKAGSFKVAFKQVCIYVFSRKYLDDFLSYDSKTYFENIEDIEILRFLGMGLKVDMVEVSSGSLAVDIPSDVEKITEAMNEK